MKYTGISNFLNYVMFNEAVQLQLFFIYYLLPRHRYQFLCLVFIAQKKNRYVKYFLLPHGIFSYYIYLNEQKNASFE